jgi:hypothetical protein
VGEVIWTAKVKITKTGAQYRDFGLRKEEVYKLKRSLPLWVGQKAQTLGKRMIREGKEPKATTLPRQPFSGQFSDLHYRL